VLLPPLGLEGLLRLPDSALGVVLFAHGSGSGRLSPRNNAVADYLSSRGLASLLMDLLTEDEADDRHKVFDIRLLAERLRHAMAWLGEDGRTRGLPIGLFGASTGAAAALVAAALSGVTVSAVVSRGGRPDLAGAALPQVRAPSLLIVGGADSEVLALNRAAFAQLRCERALKIVPDATHLFEEPGALESVAELSADWFCTHLPS